MVRLGIHVLAVQILNGGAEIHAHLLAAELAEAEILRQIRPQIILILPVGQKALGVILVVGVR